MNNLSEIHVLSEESLRIGVDALAARDSELAGIVNMLGPPPLWDRQPGFPTLVYIILEQQVSLSSARAAYQRLTQSVSPLTPERYLEIPQIQLKEFGFSRQKIGYCRFLASAILEKKLNLNDMSEMNDEEVLLYLTNFKGIGPWTAHIYLLEVLLRPDIWPIGDLALAKGIQRIRKLETKPAPELLEKMGDSWRPWRSVAARLFWHYYLNT